MGCPWLVHDPPSAGHAWIASSARPGQLAAALTEPPLKHWQQSSTRRGSAMRRPQRQDGRVSDLGAQLRSASAAALETGSEPRVVEISSVITTQHMTPPPTNSNGRSVSWTVVTRRAATLRKPAHRPRRSALVCQRDNRIDRRAHIRSLVRSLCAGPGGGSSPLVGSSGVLIPLVASAFVANVVCHLQCPCRHGFSVPDFAWTATLTLDCERFGP
jgi:hypothetical protein